MPYNFGVAAPVKAATPPPAPVTKKAGGSFDFTNGAPRAASGGTFNFATGKPVPPAKHGAASFLEKMSDYIDVPLASAQAGMSDLWGAIKDPVHPLYDVGYWATHQGPHSEKLLKDLAQGGPHQVAQNDVYFRQGSLQRVMADPSASAASKATANYFLHHPWAAGAADFIGEFANPSNLLGGPIGRGVGLAAKGVGFIARQIPHVGPALDAAGDAARALVNKYHPLHKITPVAEDVARQSDAAAKTAVAHNEALTTKIFGGANEAESTEIWRRAHGDPHKPVAGGKLTDAQLSARAGLYRASINALDQEQLARHMADKSDLMAGYFPMRPKVAYNEDAFTRTVAEVPKGPRAGITQPRLRYKAINTNEKVFRSPDEVLAAHAASGGKLLAPGFHPANEFLAHLNKISGNVTLDNFVQQMVHEAPQAAHEVTAFGLKGREAMQQGLRVAARQASYEAVTRATKEIAQQFGISEPEVRRIIARRFGMPAVVKGQIGEVQRSGRVVNRNVALYNAGVATKATTRISADFLRRGQDLAKKLTDPERNVSSEFRKLRDDFDRALQPKFKERALDAMTPQGYQRIKGVPGLSGLDRMQYTAFKPELVKYLTEYGAPRAEAEGIGAFFDRLNALYRIGIVTNPIVHPFYNLLWGYLGTGANPARLVRMFRGAPTALDHEAERYGAHAHFSSQTALGGDFGHMLMGPMNEAKGLTGKADWLISRAANANRKLVFDRLERNMASELWDDLAKKNMAKGMDQELAKRTAAMQVRKAFGDYDNISSAERNMRYAFFFYPWTKTVIPFWLKAGMERPQMTAAPLRSIQTHNALAGDPNIDKEKMGTIYMGKDSSGQPVYKSVPLPQKHLEELGELVIPRKGGEADVSAGIPERMTGLAGLAQGHLVPAYGTAAAMGSQLANAEPQEPGVTPASHVVFNRDAPLGTQLGQTASFIGSSAVPFGGTVSNLAGAFREALRGVPEAIPQALIGGFVYEQRTPLEQRSLNRFMVQFKHRYDHAAKLPAEKRAQLQAAAYALFRKQVDALLGPRKNAEPPPVPATTPATTPQGGGSFDFVTGNPKT